MRSHGRRVREPPMGLGIRCLLDPELRGREDSPARLGAVRKRSARGAPLRSAVQTLIHKGHHANRFLPSHQEWRTKQNQGPHGSGAGSGAPLSPRSSQLSLCVTRCTHHRLEHNFRRQLLLFCDGLIAFILDRQPDSERTDTTAANGGVQREL